MATTAPASSPINRAIEYRDIHLASCRYRRQGLVCSTCCDLIERVERLVARVRAAA